MQALASTHARKHTHARTQTYARTHANICTHARKHTHASTQTYARSRTDARTDFPCLRLFELLEPCDTHHAPQISTPASWRWASSQ
eukprot:5653120-Pleurochrysis_carterae.AAC.1